MSWLTSMMTGKAPHFHRKSINLTFLSFYIICIGMNYVVVRSVLKIIILLFPDNNFFFNMDFTSAVREPR